MDRPETEGCADAGQGCAGPDASSRALVAGTAAAPPPPVRGRRPLAGFLTQLIVGADPALRSSRSERTKAATALYARTAAFARRA